MTMIEHLQEIEAKHAELSNKLADPAVLADHNLFRDTGKELADIRLTVELYQRYKKTREERDSTREMLEELAKDDELYDLAKDELDQLESDAVDLEERLQRELTPQDPNDERNVVLEIRAGTGGDEATLFAAELFRMYSRFAEAQSWRIEILDLSESGVKGLKEISAIVEGKGAYKRSSTKAAYTACREFPRPRPQGESTPPRSLWRYCPKPTTSKSRSTRKICVSTATAPPAPAVRESTQPTRRSGSLTSPPGWS